jgi:hypothetical protein
MTGLRRLADIQNFNLGSAFQTIAVKIANGACVDQRRVFLCHRPVTRERHVDCMELSVEGLLSSAPRPYFHASVTAFAALSPLLKSANL